MLFNEARRYFVDRRVAERIVATGSSSFADYYIRLHADFEGEVEQFINAFTVNETYFLREDHQLRCLTSDLLGERLKARPTTQAIRIWCVPCSTGEEPYSVAIWLLEKWPQVDSHDVEIIGSDIDTSVIAAAKDGVFGRRALLRLEPALLEKYFVAEDRDNWRILDELRSSVQFTRVNVVDRHQTKQYGQFDVIFCRNLLMYFDDKYRRITAENLYESLMPGGFICLGHTESMSRVSSLFEVCRFADAVVYRKPLERAHG